MVNPSGITVCMIIKNEVPNLPRCLESLRALGSALSEICVYDTGSTDGSVQLCRELGARVEEGSWNDDFSEARNRSIAMARSDWVLIVDADQELKVDRRELLKILRHIDSHVSLISLPIVDIDSVLNGVGVLSPRLMRAGRCGYYGAIHESLRMQYSEDVMVNFAEDIAKLLHYGYSDHSTTLAKLDRNNRIARIELSRLMRNEGTSAISVNSVRSRLAQGIYRASEMQEKYNLYKEIFRDRPSPVDNVWLQAVERLADHALSSDSIVEAIAYAEILSQEGGSQSYLTWIIGRIAVRHGNFDLAFDSFSNTEYLIDSQSIIYSILPVLQARFNAALHVGQLDDALACLLSAVCNHGERGEMLTTLLRAWPPRPWNALRDIVGEEAPDILPLIHEVENGVQLQARAELR